MLKNDELLLSNGWHMIGQKRYEHGTVQYWDHPDHQPDVHGAFTKTDALKHQRRSSKYGCDCIKTSNR